MEKIGFRKLEKLLPGLKRNVLLKKFTTFKIGGKAKYFFEAKTKEGLIKAILIAKKFKLPFFILGGGSNLLVSDKGFKGLVIKIQNSEFKIQPPTKIWWGAKFKIYCEAGVPLAKLVLKTIEIGATGLEWAAGIPGTVGGAIYGNAGAFGKSMRDVVKEVEVFKIQNSKFKIQNFKNKECKFSYRESIFKKNSNLIILSATLRLKKGKRAEIKMRIQDYLNCRRKTQPLNFPSAGSIFKNPKSKIQNPKLLKEFPELKEFKKNGFIPAGWLIEKVGLRGKRVGGAKISEKHGNFILNFKNAKAKDVLKLIKIIKQKVKKKFKINLKEEIQYLGFKNKKF